jgi:hypothetical protein
VSVQINQETANIPSVCFTEEGSDIAAPSAGYAQAYVKAGILYVRNSSGIWTPMSNPMTTQDDIIIGGASGVPARLAKGSDGQLLTVDPTTHVLMWKDPPAAGGGNTIFSSAYASPPATPASGDLWLPTNGHSILRWSGSAWQPWGTLAKLNPLAVADFAWINQGGATATDSAGGIYMVAPAGTDNIHLLKKAAPATPYTITVCLIPDGMVLCNYNQVGVAFRESSSGKLVVLGIAEGEAHAIIHQTYSTPTTFNSTVKAAVANPALQWLRIADNGTNRIYSYSPDGLNWAVFNTESRATYITANEVGIYISSNNATYGPQATFTSWLAA